MTLPLRLRKVLVLSPPLIWVVLFMFVPYTILFVFSFWEQVYPTFAPAFQLGNYQTLISDPQYLRTLLRTIKIAGLVSLFSLLLAYPYAYFLVHKVRHPALRQTFIYGGGCAALGFLSATCLYLEDQSWAPRASSIPFWSRPVSCPSLPRSFSTTRPR